MLLHRCGPRRMAPQRSEASIMLATVYPREPRTCPPADGSPIRPLTDFSPKVAATPAPVRGGLGVFFPSRARSALPPAGRSPSVDVGPREAKGLP